jgi:predicted AAA+ superfamily ATPase
MADLDKIIARQAAETAFRRSKTEPVILLEGPRSTGKSTLIRALAAKFKTEVLDFDDPVVREDAARDPLFYTRPTKDAAPILIDEYQRVPAILDGIKTRMNVSSHPGQFILAGSTSHDALAGSVQALTGRLHRMRIHPFAQSELEGTKPDLVSEILLHAEAVTSREKNKPSAETRESYIGRIAAGGFPLAVMRSSAQARNRWFDDYVRQTIDRDIPGIAKVRNNRGLAALLRKLASQTAQILVLENVSKTLALDSGTIKNYLQLLEDVFVIHQLPAWGRTLQSRVSAKPKLYISDSGLAARLMGLTVEKLMAREAAAITEYRHLLETFAVSEILKELSWQDDTFLTGHWHTHEGKEVDFVIETMDGSLYGFEIKAAGRVGAESFDGLAALRKLAGGAFKGGFVLYTGPLAFRFDDGLYALPVSKLWE